MRHYLKVPYSEKDEAKRLGAKWCPFKRSWYTTGNVEQFAKWTYTEYRQLALPFTNTNDRYCNLAA